jgi:cellulose synthase/poly-beta-1,6-N-acetylglucosamine synthase-like glycosyltransferase
LTIAHWLLVVLAWIFAIGASASIVLWAMAWILLEHTMRLIPTLRVGQRLAKTVPPTGSVCVVVPAHNEARVIAGLIASLRAETYPQLRVVLALDRCTDDTATVARAAIAGDARFEIVEIDACPDDWAGKVHAVYQGMTRSPAAAAAEYLLFIDADTMLSPECIASALALMRERKLDMLSLLSTLIYDTWFTRIVQTAAAFELLRQYPLLRANGLRPRRAFANGQFMLFTHQAYQTVGGHIAVKRALLEDLALARLVARNKLNAGVFLAAGLFHCRMYPDWPQFRRGWKRIYTESANRNPTRLRVAAWRMRLLGTVLPLLTFACGIFGAATVARDATMGWTLLSLALAGTLLWLGAQLRFSGLAAAPAWTTPLHIVGAWLTGGMLSEAATDLRSQKPISWGGREYSLDNEPVAEKRDKTDAAPTVKSAPGD